MTKIAGTNSPDLTATISSNQVFTPDEVVSLLRWQTSDGLGPGFGGMPLRVHPFTCPNRGDGRHREILDDRGTLIPTVRGWICPFCDYTQDWAHASMKALPAKVA